MGSRGRCLNSEGQPCYSVTSGRTLDQRHHMDPEFRLSNRDIKPQPQVGLGLSRWPVSVCRPCLPVAPPTASYHTAFLGLIGLYLTYRPFQRYHSALKKRPRDLWYPLMRRQGEGYLWPPATWPRASHPGPIASPNPPGWPLSRPPSPAFLC